MIQATEGGGKESTLLGVGKKAGKIRKILRNSALVV